MLDDLLEWLARKGIPAPLSCTVLAIALLGIAAFVGFSLDYQKHKYYQFKVQQDCPKHQTTDAK